MLREFLKLGATCAALAVFFTPLEAARKITRERNVGALTPVPFGAIALNCSIWVVYGIIVRDWVPLVAVDKARRPAATSPAWGAGLLELVGRVGVGACVAMFASPLSTIKRVLSTRSTASMAPSVTLASAACSLLWTLDGRDIGDLYVWGPNVAGLAFSLAQLGLFGIFGMPPAPADMRPARCWTSSSR
ncbi:sugar transmembrane transporter [Aureococcus anophagefferens]|nr:sugar transmembrane transporter [Aureococcus anophagefferens]